MNLARVDAVVRERLGLDPAALGVSVLPRAVRHRMTARGLPTPEEYLSVLTTDAAEAAALAAELVVAETWFFRGGRPLFDRLAEFVARQAATRAASPVRILSVPCSTGEEPYSLAIALHEQLVPPEAYRIDAVDLSAAHLERARAGRFASFAFREIGPDIRPTFFREHADRWEILPHLRASVDFRAGNLTDRAFLAGEVLFDLILCRNLFIYLTVEARRRAMTALDRLLAPDGWLCLTPGEADRLPPGSFALEAPAEFGIYRRAGIGSLAIGAAVEVARPLRQTPAKQLAVVAESPPPVNLPTPTPRSTPPSALEAARKLADFGRLAEARSACEAILRDEAGSAEVYTLLGVIHQLRATPGLLVEAFRKALYLAPRHREALSHMIVLCERRGDAAQAAGFRKRLARAGAEDAT